MYHEKNNSLVKYSQLKKKKKECLAVAQCLFELISPHETSGRATNIR